MSDRNLALPEWAHRGDPHESCDVNPCGTADCAMRPVYGYCTGCGSVEVALNEATGTRDLSWIGESAEYPTGYGCELCS